MSAESKQCSKCGESQAITEFYHDKRLPDGRIGVCKTCKYTNHKARYRANGKAWYAENKDRAIQLCKDWDNRNRDRRIEIGREYRKRNPEKMAECVKDWARRNKPVIAAHAQARKKRLKSATPPWANMKAIVSFYKARPQGYHVDHIIPINSDQVCGLHVIENLQYLTPAENIKKFNHFDASATH